MTTAMGNSEKPSVLHSVADMLSRQVTMDQLLNSMVDLVVEEVGAERGTLYVFHDHGVINLDTIE